jgi:transcription elongation GreA/GreB family factor
MVNIELKNKIISACHEILNEKKGNALKMVAHAESARNNETKSSAGDKYETGRSMMQMERDKAESVLIQISELQSQLNRMVKIKSDNFVQHGSLVVTSEATYLIAIPLGKVNTEYCTCYVISPESPLSKAIWGKTTGDLIQFLNRDIEILKIL